MHALLLNQHFIPFLELVDKWSIGTKEALLGDSPKWTVGSVRFSWPDFILPRNTLVVNPVILEEVQLHFSSMLLTCAH